MAFTAAQSEVRQALDEAERCVAATGAALLRGEPAQLQAATRELHDSAHALALVLRGVDGGAALARGVHERLIRVARDIARQREALLRRCAAVDRSLQTLVPQQNQASTYSGALNRYAGRAASGTSFRTF